MIPLLVTITLQFQKKERVVQRQMETNGKYQQ